MKRISILFAVLFALNANLHAVFFYSTGTSTYNTTAPGDVDGLNADAIWNLEGNFGSFLGTPISSQYFITAKHIGGSIGDSITFSAGANAGTYLTVDYEDSPTTDLRIWKISGTFVEFAELYTDADEAGKSLIVFGRGTQRGAEYLGPSSDLRGWVWGTADGVKRWGENTVAGYANSGSLLAATFSSSGGPNEAMLSVGDSGGAVFIQDDGIWKLAGINYAVSGAFYSNTGVNGSGVEAGLFNQNSLYSSNVNSGFNPLSSSAGPGLFYATRISQEEDWILSVIPEPSSAALCVAGVFMMFAGWRSRSRLAGTPRHRV